LRFGHFFSSSATELKPVAFAACVRIPVGVLPCFFLDRTRREMKIENKWGKEKKLWKHAGYLQADATVAITATSRAFPSIKLAYLFCPFSISADSVHGKQDPSRVTA
jgi:hypothetical protein